jgi:hypothetical protein
MVKFLQDHQGSAAELQPEIDSQHSEAELHLSKNWKNQICGIFKYINRKKEEFLKAFRY